MNPNRITLERIGNHIVVVLDKGADYLKEFSIIAWGDEKANQLAATYREGYLDGIRSVSKA